MSLVKLDVAPCDMASALTTESLDEMDLKFGDKVGLVVRAVIVLPVKEQAGGKVGASLAILPPVACRRLALAAGPFPWRPFVSVTWEESYEIGNAAIDAEHRELLAIVDELESTDAETHRSSAVILGVLSHLMDSTLAHFMMEEQLMLEVGYPANLRVQMIEQHREFTSYARLRVLEYRAGMLASVLPLQAFLAEWLTVHEFGMDRLFAEFMRTGGSAVSISEVSEKTVLGVSEP